MKKINLFLVILIITVCSCNNAEKKTAVKDDTVRVVSGDTTIHAYTDRDTVTEALSDSVKTIIEIRTDSVRKVTDSSVIKISEKKKNKAKTKAKNTGKDTITNPPVVSNQKKSAVLGYSYFGHMRQDETRNIYAYVLALNKGNDINKLVENITADLKEANNQVKPERKSDTASFFTSDNIYFYKYLTITLSDPGSNFKIDSLGISARQLIDTSEENKWQWAVTPKTSIKYARLILKVAAEKEDGTQKPIGTREIAITIQLETNFWREVITWLRNNPEKLLVLILIPLAVYFGKKIFDRRKKPKDDDPDDEG